MHWRLLALLLALAAPGSEAHGQTPDAQNAPAAVPISTMSATLSTPPAPGVVKTSTAPAGGPGAPVAVSTAAVSLSTAAASPEAEPAPPWVIGQIEIKGNRHVTSSVVRGQIKARKGDLYQPADLKDDIEKLLRMGSFDQVSAGLSALPAPVPRQFIGAAGSSTTSKLTWTVEEKPIIKRIRFEGHKEIGRGKLSDATTLKEKDSLDLVKARVDADKMLELYREKGHLGATVDYKIVRDTKAATADLTYVIVEGPRTVVYEFFIDGATAFTPKKILKELTNRPKKVLQEAKIAEDLDKITSFYKNKGYFHFEVSTWSLHISSDHTEAVLLLSIDEGRLERFGESGFTGYTVYAATDLAKAVDYKPGRIFSQERFDNTVRGLQELYADKGYLRAVISPATSYNLATERLDIRYDIAEDRLVYVDFIGIEGAKATKPWVFSREVLLKTGQPFSAVKARKSRERIMNLGFIDDVGLSFHPTAEPDKVDLTFEVVEGKPGMLTAGAGFSSLDGLIGTLSMQHMNLFGRAQRTSVAWSFGKRVQDYSVSWLTPWIADKPISLGFDVFNTRRIHPFANSSSGFVYRRTGGSVRLGPRFQDDKYQLGLTYTLQRVGIGNVDQTFQNQLSEGTSIHSSIGVELARDTRDYYLDPTRGSRNSVGVTLTGGPLMGDIDFWKPYISNSIHFTLASPWDYPLVLTFANRAGYATQFGKTDSVPVFDRFFLGGQDTLRGYTPTGQVGFPSGGKVYDVFNVELGFPLARERRRTIVKLVGFFDAGSSWDRAQDVHLRVGSYERDIKTDAGIGLRFVTPAFPIRLDWGYGFNHRSGDRKYEINFGIGSLF